jgi:hypothetical protein
MNRVAFPWIAAGVGLVLALVLFQGGVGQPGGGKGLPLLTSLLIAELGFFVGVGGTYLAFRQWRAGTEPRLPVAASGLACAVLAVGFLVAGVSIWNGSVAS